MSFSANTSPLVPIVDDTKQLHTNGQDVLDVPLAFTFHTEHLDIHDNGYISSEACTPLNITTVSPNSSDARHSRRATPHQAIDNSPLSSPISSRSGSCTPDYRNIAGKRGLCLI